MTLGYTQSCYYTGGSLSYMNPLHVERAFGHDLREFNGSLVLKDLSFVVFVVYLLLRRALAEGGRPRRGGALRAAGAEHRGLRKCDFIHHLHHPEGVVYRSACLNSSTFAIS